MRNDPSILSALQSGYREEQNNHCYSSDKWLAHEAGYTLNKRGMPSIRAAAKSRGYSIRVETVSHNEMIIHFNKNTLTPDSIERINR